MKLEVMLETARQLFREPEFIALVSEKLIKPAISDALDIKIAETNKKIDDMNDKFIAMTEKLEAAERKIQQLEAYSRRNCITISGVPETDGEDTDQLVLDIAKSAGVILSPDDIDVSHRLGRKGKKHRALIAKFVTRNVREKVFNARRDKTANRVRNHQVLTEEVLRNTFISECLTPQAQQLLFVCRQLKREDRLWAAYSTNGRIKIKVEQDQTPKTIDSLAQIEELAGHQWVQNLLQSPRRDTEDTAPAGRRPERGGSRVPVATRQQPVRGSSTR